MLIFSLAAAFSIEPKLCFIFVVFVPVLAIGLTIIAKKAHSRFIHMFKRFDKLNTVVQENLRGIRVVKAFVRENYEEEKFKDASKSIFDLSTAAEKIIAFNGPLMQFCMYGCMILISWLGAKAVVACGGDAALGLSTGELTSLFT